MKSFRVHQKNSKRPEHSSGAATVETALVLPLFLMVMLGIVEIGRAFMVGQLLTSAAREGGRLAIMSGSTNDEVIQLVKDLAQQTANIDPEDIDVVITISEYPGNPDTSDDLSLANKRDLCTIVASVDHDKVSFLPENILAGIQLSGQVAMRHE